MKTKLAFFLVFSTLCFSSCSSLSFSGRTHSSHELHSPVRLTVLSMTKKYLDAIVQLDEHALDRVVLWGEYNSEFKDIERTKVFIVQKIKVLKPGWNANGSPFKGFSVKDVDIDEDTAEVELTRDGTELDIEFRWTGRAWLIVSDNIFGENGYVSKLEG